MWYGRCLNALDPKILGLSSPAADDAYRRKAWRDESLALCRRLVSGAVDARSSPRFQLPYAVAYRQAALRASVHCMEPCEGRKRATSEVYSVGSCEFGSHSGVRRRFKSGGVGLGHVSNACLEHTKRRKVHRKRSIEWMAKAERLGNADCIMLSAVLFVCEDLSLLNRRQYKK